MPIDLQIPVRVVEQDEFHALDRTVMRAAFDAHNSLGRFCDEKIYRDEIAERCQDLGFAVAREVEIRTVHRDFTKSYFMDLVVENAAIYELKTTESLNSAHQNQLLHYLLLAGSHHGKILNLRPASLKYRFVSTSMARTDRTNAQIRHIGARVRDEPTALLLGVLSELLADWGSCLDVTLYRDALLHFTGTESTGLQSIAIVRGSRIIGHQKMHLLAPDTAWHLSSLSASLVSYESHLRRLLSHTALREMIWINLYRNHAEVRHVSNTLLSKNHSVKK